MICMAIFFAQFIIYQVGVTAAESLQDVSAGVDLDGVVLQGRIRGSVTVVFSAADVGLR